MRKIIILLFISTLNSYSQSSICFNAITYTLNLDAKYVISKDFNNDGLVDIATIAGPYSSSSTNTLSVLLSSGQGSFSAPVDYTVGTYAFSLISEDLNNDGNNDIVVGDKDGIKVFIGTGSGVFFTSFSYTLTGYGATNLIADDFNGDNKLDLALLVAYDKLCVVLGNGVGSFSNQFYYTIGSDARCLTSADFNGDGKKDILTTNLSSTNYSVLLNTGNGNFALPVNHSCPVYGDPFSVVSHDFDNDGKIDIAYIDKYNYNVWILKGSGNGTFTYHSNYFIGLALESLSLKDFNNDGKIDLFVLNDEDVTILLGQGNGFFSKPISYEIKGPLLFSATAADFDGDGIIDILANYTSEAAIIKGTGTGSFLAPIDYHFGSNPGLLTVADYNGDGLPDLCKLCGSPNKINVCLADGLGGYLTPIYTSLSYGGNLKAVESKDVNNDGKIDLIFNGGSSGTVAINVLLGIGTGSFMPQVSFPTANVIGTNLIVEDFNNDGKLDILTCDPNNNLSSGDIFVLLGNGLGNFSPLGTFVATTTVPYTKKMDFGDFNGDGNNDIIINYGNNFSILLGSNSGAPSAPVNFTLSTLDYMTTMSCADYNNDGLTDIAISTGSYPPAKRLHIYFGSSSSIVSLHSNQLMNLDVVKSSDLNNDGNIDIAALDRILIGQGNGNFISTQQFNNLISTNTFISDLNADGLKDFVFNGASDVVRTIINGVPSLVTSNSNTICIGSSANIIASGASTYSWSNGSTGATLGAYPTSNTNYTVIGTNNAGCSSSQTVMVIVDNTCADVWPGDANSDGIVDNTDVLELGLHYTLTGTPRANTSNLWQSYYSANWTGTITNGKNLNHSNCNGDGIIDDNDTLAIFNNYNLTHAFKLEQTTASPQLTIIPDQAYIGKGTWGSASIYLGDATSPINNINGIAYTINYDNTLIDLNSVWVEYPISFINAGNQNLNFRKLDFSNNKLYTATTHTINGNVSGYGKIATLHYKINPNLILDNTLNLSISQANQSNDNGVIVPLIGGNSFVEVRVIIAGENDYYIYPNPTNDLLTITSQTVLQKIEVISITGQILYSQPPTNTNSKLSLENLATGVYFINLYQNDRVVKREKVMVNR